MSKSSITAQTELCVKEHAPHRKIIKQITNNYGPGQGCPFQVKEVFRLTRGTGAADPSPAHSEVRPRKSTIPPHRRNAAAIDIVLPEQSAKLPTTVAGSGHTSPTGEADVAAAEDDPEGVPKGASA